MTTLPPPEVKKFSENSNESKVYSMIETFKEYIPVQNDRYRLSFNLLRNLKSGGDTPLIIVKSSKLTLEGIGVVELAKKIEDSLKNI